MVVISFVIPVLERLTIAEDQAEFSTFLITERHTASHSACHQVTLCSLRSQPFQQVVEPRSRH